MVGLHIFTVLIFLTVCPLTTLAANQVQFSFGRVQGVDEQAQDTLKPYYAYYGIPFAKPPVHERRFKPPEAYKGTDSSNVISSTTFRDSCMQPAVLTPGFQMSEDCLYLNIFTPPGNFNSGQPKKVMVWIYGGAFMTGDAFIYKPSKLVTDYDVIVVTFHYRLNIFGFLSSGKGSGNYGLYDQVMALQWVKDNIAQFGGDANDITIFGESAGGASVSLLSLSPLTKGLFTKAIIQSGPPNGQWVIKNQPENQFADVAKEAGCLPWYYFGWLKNSVTPNIMNCFRSKTAYELFAAFLKVGGIDISGGTTVADNAGDAPAFEYQDLQDNNFLFTPVVDGYLIPRNPSSLLADKNYLRQNGVLDRSYIIGFTNQEGLFNIEYYLSIPGAKLDAVTNVDDAEKNVMLNTEAEFPFASNTRDIDSVVRYEYLYPRFQDGKVPLKNLVNFITDVNYVVPSVKFARAIYQASSNTPVYMYLFDHYPEVKDPELGVSGSSHAMDLVYLFDRDDGLTKAFDYYTTVPSPTLSDLPLFDAFMGSLTQFAKTGSPARINQEPRSWPAYEPENEYYLAMSVTPELRQRVYAKRVQLWTEVVPDLFAKHSRWAR